jgi:hypothetical protein
MYGEQQSEEASQGEEDPRVGEVHLEIANLNTKYANDIKNVKCVIESDCLGQKSNLQTRYIEDYNLLQAKFQQIKYGN